MANKFVLEVVTPDKQFFEEEVSMVVFKTMEGDIGVLYDHEPLVAPVKVGKIRIKNDSGKFDVAACSSGFVTINDDKVTIVTDSAEWAKDIDIERAKQAKERAEMRINEGEDKEIDVSRAKASLTRAINRINTQEIG